MMTRSDFAFTLTGTMPLLMHADNIDAADVLSAWRKDPANKNQSKPGDDRTPPWAWQTYCYSDGEHVAIPSENIMTCLRDAGKQVILKKQKTFKEASQSGLLIGNEFCDLFVAGKKLPITSLAKMKDQPFSDQANESQKLGFKLFQKRARVGTAKHIRIRPRFDEWAVRGSIKILTQDITPEILLQLFEIAGKIGIGDWRPGCRTPGPFGMFTAALE